MLGFELTQISITAKKTSDGNYKVNVHHKEIFSERVMDEKTFAQFREAVGAANPSVGAPELVG
jgi:hypothetical protein